MTHDEVMDAFEEHVAEGEKAEQEKAFRQAAGIFAEVSGAYSERAIAAGDPLNATPPQHRLAWPRMLVCSDSSIGAGS
jgi:hypothetical protein